MLRYGGMNMLGTMEATGATARAGTLRRRYREGGFREIEKTHRHRSGTCPEVWCTRSEAAYDEGVNTACQHDAFR